MEQIIEAFGIDERLIIIQIINFAILMAALGYFLYKPVLKLLREREEKIAQGLKDAEEAAVAKTSAETEKQAVLAAAHKDAAAVGERAKTAADTKSAEIVAAAEEKAAELVRSAEAKGEAMKAQVLKESESEVAKLAILAAEKVLREKTK